MESRPTKFTTDSGKVIVVEQQVAKRNDETMKKGTVSMIYVPSQLGVYVSIACTREARERRA